MRAADIACGSVGSGVEGGNARLGSKATHHLCEVEKMSGVQEFNFSSPDPLSDVAFGLLSGHVHLWFGLTVPLSLTVIGNLGRSPCRRKKKKKR